MNNIITTIKKELRSILRDKKTISVLFIYPLMIPFMVILYGNLYDNMDNEVTEYTIGINYELSKEEVAVMNELHINYQVYDTISDMQKAYDKKEITGFIDYQNNLNNYNIYINTSTSSGLTTSELISQYLENYNLILTNNYLVEEGIDLEKAYNHFSVQEQELSTNNYIVVLLLSISITYIILSICISTSNMAIQTTATEKENGTLETILTFPIKKNELIIGKYLSTVSIGFISSLCSLAFMLISMYIGKHHYAIYEDLNISFSLTTIIGSIIISLIASIFISGISLSLTAFAKSYKEAQGQSSLITLVATIPMFVSIMELNISRTYYLIPICNITQTLSDLFANSIDITNILITMSSTIFYTIIVITIIIKAYNSEKILFSN